jgi:hypothetical protein
LIKTCCNVSGTPFLKRLRPSENIEEAGRREMTRRQSVDSQNHREIKREEGEGLLMWSLVVIRNGKLSNRAQKYK